MKPPEEAIYNATQTCRKSLSECLEVKELMQNEWAENRLADFNLWASGLGASVQGRASLDARLASRPDARDAVTNLLQVLVGAVEDCKALVRGSAESTSAGCDEGHPTSDSEEDPPRSFSPWSDDSDSDSDLESTLNDSPLDKAKETVNSLLDLLVRIAITIRRSGTQSRLRKADRKFKTEDHEELQRHLIVIMLSQGPFSSDHTFSPDQTDPSKLTPIQWRLLNCNLKRRNRFLYAQRHSEALDTPKSSSNRQDTTAKPVVQDLPARPMSSALVQKPGLRSIAMATSASGITDLPAVLPALPKGTASSHATRTNLSITVTKLPYPRPPKVDDDTMVFRCPCCCQTLPVGILETSRWKKHLAEDIQPYTCVLYGCPNPEVLYVTKKEWELHLRDAHGSCDVWTCFACLDSLHFEAEAEFVAHTLQEHRETISEGQIRALVSACKTSITAELTSCPLCAWPIADEGEISRTALLDHVAEHIHAFSLRALPWAPDAVHDIETGIQTATAKVQPWLTKHNLTSETLTVMDNSIPTSEPSSPTPHYFDTHDYFADDSNNRSCSTVSDGTIDRELWEGSLPLSEDSDGGDDVIEPARQDVASEEDSYHEEAEEDEDDIESYNEVDLHISDDDNHVVETITISDDYSIDIEDSDLEYESDGAIRPPIHGDEYASRSHYRFGGIISSGDYSVVCKARAQSRQDLLAIKSMKKSIFKGRIHELYQEIELLQYVRHPSIVRFVDWFESKGNYFIVTELAEGGELLDRVAEEGRFSEPDAKRAVREILATIGYLHHHGIVHRHLTVEKFRYLTRDERSPLILVSLACADWENIEERRILPIDSDESASRASAPEIMHQQRSGKPADMWSIGVIAYMMLAGYSPFRSEYFRDYVEECSMGMIVFHQRYWKDISDFAKAFIQRLLKPKPEDRLTVEEAELHPWITGKDEMPETRGCLVRARWKCVILKVQLALQIQQLPTQQDNLGSSADDTQDDPVERRYQRKLSAWTNRILSDPDLKFEEFHNCYIDRCQKPIRTAALILMATQEVENLVLDLSQARPTLRQLLA